MATLEELKTKYSNQLRDFQYSPDVYLKKQWGLLPFNQYTDRQGFVVPTEITQNVWSSLTPQEQQTALQGNPTLAKFGIGGFAEVAGGTSQGAKLLESIQSPFTQAERTRDAASLGGTPVGIVTSQPARDQTLTNQTELQRIQQQFQAIQQNIATKGIIDASGKQIVAPGAYNPTTGLFNISGSPITGAMINQINDASNQGVVNQADYDALKKKEADALAALQNAQSSSTNPRELDFWMKRFDEQKKQYETQLSDYFKGLESLRADRARLAVPGAKEVELSKQLKDLRMEADRFALQTEQDKFAEFSGQTLGFAQGRASEIDIKASFKRQEQALQEKNLLLELGLAQEARKLELGTVEQSLEDFKSDFELQQKINDKLDEKEDALLEQVNTLTKESQKTLMDLLDNFEGFDWNDLGKESQNKLTELASQAGIPANLISDALSAQKGRYILEQSQKAAGRNRETEKPLSILDIQRYNELYPTAGVTAGDTQEIADKKVAATNTPKAKMKVLIQAAKDNGNSYEKVVEEINNDKTISDKKTALKIANEIFDITEQEPVTPILGTGNFAKVSLDDRVARLQQQNQGNGFPKNLGLREQLAKEGYPIQEIDTRLANVFEKFVNSISNFLFK